MKQAPHTQLSLTPHVRAKISKLVLAAEYEHKHRGRHSLPWRTTRDPYAILVSETMLQQTQVARVIPKFEAWMKMFPTPHALANAQTRDVLTAWSGLGYNRRALSLKRSAEMIVSKHNGSIPADLDALLALPGVGAYTARAVLAFAFDIGLPLIETNVRTVFIHHLFPRTKRLITDNELLPLVAYSLQGKSARTWYAALMDYGTRLKSELGSKKTILHNKSSSYSKQSKFEGSTRQLRAAILKRVLAAGDAGVAHKELLRLFSKSHHDPAVAIASLEREGMVKISKGTVRA
jgi:A/G-specific adenine glycosylase